MSRNLKKSVADINGLYEVVADAYWNDVLLYYCLKCFKLFLSEREKLKHDKTHGSEEFVDQQTSTKSNFVSRLTDWYIINEHYLEVIYES